MANLKMSHNQMIKFSICYQSMIQNSERYYKKSRLESCNSYAELWIAEETHEHRKYFIYQRIRDNPNESETDKYFLKELETYFKIKPCVAIEYLIGYYILPRKGIITCCYPNGNLENVIKMRKLSNTQKAICIFTIATGMMHLHSQNIIHSNLNPGSILFKSNMEPVITNIAQTSQNLSPYDNSRYKMFVDPSYMEFDQDNPSSYYRKEADVFSFAMILYFILTDQLETDIDLTNSRPELPNDISPCLKKIILHSWQIDSKSRPTFSQIIHLLLNECDIFPDMNVEQYCLYQDQLLEEVTINECDRSLLKKSKGKIQNEKDIQAFLLAKKEADEGNVTQMLHTARRYGRGQGTKKDKVKAAEYYKKAADRNNSIGQYNYGQILWNGIGIKKDEKMAAKYFEMAARDKGLIDAQFVYAIFLRDGLGLTQDLRTAEKLFQEAAENGKDLSYLLLARMVFQQKRYKEAIKYYKIAVEKEIDGSYNELANMYLQGQGCDIDEDLACEYLQRGASRNSSSSKIALSNLYLEGKYIEKDEEHAYELLKEAADQHNANAALKYGKLLYSGNKYIKKDINKAIKYFQIAAKGRNYIAYHNLASIFLESNKSKEQEEGIQYLNKAIEYNLHPSMFKLGECYENGIGVKKDINKAREYYIRASQNPQMKQMVNERLQKLNKM